MFMLTIKIIEVLSTIAAGKVKKVKGAPQEALFQFIEYAEVSILLLGDRIDVDANTKWQLLRLSTGAEKTLFEDKLAEFLAASNKTVDDMKAASPEGPFPRKW